MKPLYKVILAMFAVSGFISHMIGLEDLAVILVGFCLAVGPLLALGEGNKVSKKETNKEPTMVIFDKNGKEIFRK